MSCDLKLNDLLELSKVYAPEYNMPELHDRVLVFDVMSDGWETEAILDAASVHESSADETSVTVSNEVNEDKNEEQSNPASEISAGEESNAVKSNIVADVGLVETGCTSGQNSSKTNEKTLVATDENQLGESSSSSVENRELSENGVLRQHKIFVHTSWLAVQSKYFRSLFYSGMKESNCNEVHVKVSEFEEETHLTLLEAIYKADILNDATVEELLAVLELADKYDARFVFKKCKYVLQTRVNTVDICKQVMHVIKEKHSLEDVEDLAATMQVTMGKTYSPIENHWQTQNFTSQSQPFVQYLLASSDLLTRCENTVFQALMHWMETNNIEPTSLEQDSGLLKAVRFEMLTIDYLYNVVRVHPIASKMPGFQELMLTGMTYHALSPELKQRLGEVTPRQRQNLGGNEFQFNWSIPKTQLFSCSTSTPIDSEIFWLCGYKAMIQIIYSNRNATYLSVKIRLLLLDLTVKSYVPLSWRTQGPGTSYNSNYNFQNSVVSSERLVNLPLNTIVETNFIQIIVNQF